ncbi:MAG: methyltransferase domain-containing protein [Actinomycetota bacterium]|nr:methyltransferase domain-containing protein [Actinomycetota bacterium]
MWAFDVERSYRDRRTADEWDSKWRRADFEPAWRIRSIPSELRRATEQGWFPPGGSVLDIGCGSGETTRWLAEQGYTAAGIDFSRAAIARAKAAGDLPHLTFEIFDIGRGAPRTSEFDALLDRGCLHTIGEDRRAAYVRNVATAAKPGAPFLLLVPHPPRRKDEWIRYLQELLRPAFAIERVTETVFDGHFAPNAGAVQRGVAFWMTRHHTLETEGISMPVETELEHIQEQLRAHIMSLWLAGEGDGVLHPDDDVLRSGLIDSMGIMELISFIEESFGVAVDDLEIVPENFCSLRAMTRFVAGKKQIPFEEVGDPLVADFRGLVDENVPRNAVVLVASRGDERLVELGDRTGWHFPRDDSGDYAGYHPADSVQAIGHVEALRGLGATHIGFPSGELWWLDYYTGLRDHLKSRYPEIARHVAGALYSLRPDGA